MCQNGLLVRALERGLGPELLRQNSFEMALA